MQSLIWALRILIVAILSAIVAVLITVAVVWFIEKPDWKHWKWAIDSLIP